MLDILAITVPIYVAIALGYGLTRWGIFAKADMRAFGTFVVKVAMPALLFNALSQRSLSDILNSEYVAAYALASLITLSLSIVWALKVLKTSRSLSACYGLGMTCPNSGFVGYPIVLLSLGPIAGVALALNMIVENLLIIPILLAWAETGSGRRRWHEILIQTLQGMFKNPMIWGIVLGFAFSWFSLQSASIVNRGGRHQFRQGTDLTSGGGHQRFTVVFVQPFSET
jgi:predicted permease